MTLRVSITIVIFLVMILKVFAQKDTCILKMYKTYSNYTKDSFECFQYVFSNPFFSRNKFLKVKIDSQIQKVLKSNYWGAEVNHHVKGVTIKQVFRFDPYTGQTFALQQIDSNFIVYYLLARFKSGLLKVVSLELNSRFPEERNFVPVNREGMKFLFGKKSNWKQKLRSIKAIKPDSNINNAIKLKWIRIWSA